MGLFGDRKKLDQVRGTDRKRQAYQQRCQAYEPKSPDHAAAHAYGRGVKAWFELTPKQQDIADRLGY